MFCVCIVRGNIVGIAGQREAIFLRAHVLLKNVTSKNTICCSITRPPSRCKVAHRVKCGPFVQRKSVEQLLPTAAKNRLHGQVSQTDRQTDRQTNRSARTHTCSQTHSHTKLTYAHTLTLSHTLTHTHSHTLTDTHSHTHALTLTDTITHTRTTLTHSHTHALTLTHTLTHTHSQIHTHTHKHTLTHTLTLTHTHIHRTTH